MSRMSVPLYYRLLFLGLMLLLSARSIFALHAWHVVLQWIGLALLIWALLLMIKGRRDHTLAPVARCEVGDELPPSQRP